MQARLRADGIPFTAISAPYEGVTGGPPQANELEQFADLYLDPDDPDTFHPLLATSEAELQELMPWSDNYPRHCLLNPEREIIWCGHGHGMEELAEERVREAWAQGH